MELSYLNKDINNSPINNYLSLSPKNSKIDTLYLECTKILAYIKTNTNVPERKQIEFFNEIVKNINDFTGENSQIRNISETMKYNKVLDITGYLDNNQYQATSVDLIGVFDNTINNNVINIESNGENIDILEREGINMDVSKSYTKDFLPQITMGTFAGLISTSFNIALDYILAPLLFFSIFDIVLNGIADLMNKERKSDLFRRIVQYFIIFLGSTGIVLFELMFSQYNLVTFLKPILEKHIFLYCFLLSNVFFSINHILDGATRIGLPMGIFNGMIKVSLEKFGPDLIKKIEEYIPNKHDEDKNGK